MEETRSLDIPRPNFSPCKSRDTPRHPKREDIGHKHFHKEGKSSSKVSKFTTGVCVIYSYANECMCAKFKQKLSSGSYMYASVYVKITYLTSIIITSHDLCVAKESRMVREGLSSCFFMYLCDLCT